MLLALFDLARGRGLTPLCTAGIALVFVGCVLASRSAPAEIASKRGAGRAAPWLALVAVATVAYSAVDKIALEQLPPTAAVAARYSVWEALATVPFLAALPARGAAGRDRDRAADRPSPRWTVVAAALSFVSYGLALCAYQISAHVSTIAALRQMSIPLGVGASWLLFGERVTRSRATAAGVIALGVASVIAGGP